MPSVDVVIAGGGIAGLLLAGELAPHCSVLLLEQQAEIPTGKYWLTDAMAIVNSPELVTCVDRELSSMDFIAYDGLTARLTGRYHLWNSNKLISHLMTLARNVTVMTDHRLYSIFQKGTGVVVRANSEAVQARLLVDCMGFGSPLVGAKRVATIAGYYSVYGIEVRTTRDIEPIGLENSTINRHPIYFEAFPTSRQTAVAAVIVPTRSHKADRPLKAELNFILRKSHRRGDFVVENGTVLDTFFGIIPVGRLHTPTLDNIVFFGEAAQTNPATSATGLSRMLRTYKPTAAAILSCLRRGTLKQAELARALPAAMTRMNRAFQESLFESILEFDSDDFRRLVKDIHHYPDDVVNSFVFADFHFSASATLRLLADTVRRPRGVLSRHILRALLRNRVRRN